MAVKRRWAPAGRWLGVLAIVACTGTLARAELQVRDLTGTAVEGVGPYHQDVKDAIGAFAARDYKTALAHLQNAKKLTPALAPAEVMMARLYFDALQPRLGIAMLEAAAQSAPNDPESFVALAERALAEGRVTEAELLFPRIENLVEGFNQNPRRRQDLRLRAYTVGAAVDQFRGKLDAAKTKLESLIKLDPRNASAHEKLGRLLFAQNNPRGAYDEFKLAAQVDKNAVPAELVMATLFADQISAEKWLDHAITKNPDDLRTQLGAANYRLKTNEIEKARKHAEKALELDPRGFDSNMLVGLIARMDGDYAKAEKHLSAAHLLEPVNFVVLSHLALVLLELPDDASHLRALQIAELTARENPDNPDYLGTLAWINYRLNRKADADRFFTAAFNSRQIQTTQTMTSEMGYFLAHLAKDRGKPEEAIRLLRDALNTEKPFAYRRAAQQMLAQLTKSSDGSPEASSGSTKTGQQAR
ncbi:MAG: tetratricopeptide repeat protein [Pirellulales bacterium]